MMQALTDEQSEQFEAITSGEYTNFALVSSEFQGQPVAVIAAMNDAPDDGVFITPVAILIDSSNEDFFMSQLADPTAGLEEVA